MSNKKLVELKEVERKSKAILQKYWSYKTIHKDPYEPKYYVSLELFVPIPNRDNPFPCVLVNIYNSSGRVFFRILDIKELSFFAEIDAEEIGNCQMALKLANSEARKILEANRELEYRSRLPEGMKHVYYNENTSEVTDPITGEVIKVNELFTKR